MEKSIFVRNRVQTYLWLRKEKIMSRARMKGKDLPFNPLDVIKQIKGWEGTEFDRVD